MNRTVRDLIQPLTGESNNRSKHFLRQAGQAAREHNDIAVDQPRLARVADASPAGPPDRDVASLSEFEKASKTRIPWRGKTTACERNFRSCANISGWEDVVAWCRCSRFQVLLKVPRRISLNECGNRRHPRTSTHQSGPKGKRRAHINRSPPFSECRAAAIDERSRCPETS